ncbi:MAG: hypothetical protein EXQ58_10335 [Acidobacteria bacterium]|nr:hypothetical protein [Acidobacteriota bacterium]
MLESVSLDRGYWDKKKLGEIETSSGIKLYGPQKGKKKMERVAPCRQAKSFVSSSAFGSGLKGV